MDGLCSCSFSYIYQKETIAEMSVVVIWGCFLSFLVFWNFVRWIGFCFCEGRAFVEWGNDIDESKISFGILVYFLKSENENSLLFWMWFSSDLYLCNFDDLHLLHNWKFHITLHSTLIAKIACKKPKIHRNYHKCLSMFVRLLMDFCSVDS